MATNLFNLKTDDQLLSALAASVTRTQSADDRREQRVSFIFGSLDADSDITRERVREILDSEDICD